MPGERHHSIRCFPRDDVAFQSYVAECEAELGYREAGDPWALERQIRRRYPRSTVHVQTELAAIDQRVIWYVFRDGGLDVRG